MRRQKNHLNRIRLIKKVLYPNSKVGIVDTLFAWVLGLLFYFGTITVMITGLYNSKSGECMGIGWTNFIIHATFVIVNILIGFITKGNLILLQILMFLLVLLGTLRLTYNCYYGDLSFTEYSNLLLTF